MDGSWKSRMTQMAWPSQNYESWVVPAGVPSALADIGGGVEANY